MSKSREDYLEAIYRICKKEGVARVKDIGKELDVSLASVNYAVNALSEAGLLRHKKYGYVYITDKGEEIGRGIYRKHVFIKYFLKKILKIDDRTAEEDACRIEHVISEETFSKLIHFIENVKNGEYR